MMDTIYLDNNATAPLLPEVAAALRAAEAQNYANPASQHFAGRAARRALEEAREGIGELLGADLSSFQADQVIFTSGGTEANNLALRGLLRQPPGRIVISAIEHSSVTETARYLATQGWHIDQLGVTRDGVIRLDQLADLLRPDTRLASLMLGNNETGVLQPVAEAAKICAAAGVPLHTDAVQVVGKLPVDFRALGVAALSCTAHKFHGPRGIGALLVRHGVPLEPLFWGGFQQAALRPGTESVALALGMHAALRLWHAQQSQCIAHLTQLGERLVERLRAGWPELVIHGAAAPRLPHTLCVSFPGLDRQRLVIALDLAGVACSTGSACASGSSEPSPVLLAMGLEAGWVESAIRLSWGRQHTFAEVELAAERILSVCNSLRQTPAGRKLP